ncbi:Hypothetical Protein FCC1311_093682 [Hondaea fermentalgiana]|uniref:VTT domain-containing protein n=1 Tax=Hondaea fermentalgiana TaxID=2315210 RepID=A0A2R5GYS0_9STRA|nr:Hypothetical Protein FCC1311_093682 [Hondaea fermentalgiana]|eukprot:GBG33144.1 Hypothetical Protein FCC1311_093682 [Hondaea fermentalgiana]
MQTAQEQRHLGHVTAVTRRPLGWTLQQDSGFVGDKAGHDDVESGGLSAVLKEAERTPARAALRVARKSVALLAPVVVFVVAPVILLQPLLTPMLETIAKEFSLGLSIWANSRFVVFMSVLSMVPGFPVLAIVATLGSMLPFGDALLVGTCTRHLSACLSYLVGRHFLRSRKDSLLQKWSHLKPIAHMAEVQPWRITFLSRFIMLPEQVKNYSLGALSVQFFTFFWMALLGDLQGTLFAVLIGSLSDASGVVPEVDALSRADAGDLEMEKFLKSSLSVVGTLASIAMMAIASIHVKRIHAQFTPREHATGAAHRHPHVHRQRAQSDRESQPFFRQRLRRHSLLENLV